MQHYDTNPMTHLPKLTNWWQFFWLLHSKITRSKKKNTRDGKTKQKLTKAWSLKLQELQELHLKCNIYDTNPMTHLPNLKNWWQFFQLLHSKNTRSKKYQRTEKIKSSKTRIPNTTRAASRASSRAAASPPKMDQSSNQAGKQASKQARQWWDLNAVIGTSEVLIHSLEPTHIVMGMRHQVHIQFPTHSNWTGVVNSGTKSELLLLLSIAPNAVAAPADPSQHEQRPKTQEGGIDHMMMMMMMILLSPLHHQTDGYWISFFLSSPKFPLQNSSSSQVCLQISSSARQRDLFLLV